MFYQLSTYQIDLDTIQNLSTLEDCHRYTFLLADTYFLVFNTTTSEEKNYLCSGCFWNFAFQRRRTIAGNICGWREKKGRIGDTLISRCLDSLLLFVSVMTICAADGVTRVHALAALFAREVGKLQISTIPGRFLVFELINIQTII